MADHPAHYLSVEEATDLLRVTAHTVYRWCRSGRLKAVKVGKEWRIPAGELRRHGDPSGLMPLDALLNSLVGKSEHLVGVTWDQAQLERLEATFFESAAAAGGRLVYGQWPSDREGIRQRLRPVAGPSEPRLRILDFPRAYERDGPDGVVKLISREVSSTRTSKRPCFVFGPPLSYFGYRHDRALAYEQELDKGLKGLDCIVLCGYAIAEVQSAATIALLVDLMESHSGTIFFDGKRALLVRPAG